MDGNFQQLLFQEIGRLVEPLERAAKSDRYRRSLFADVGWLIEAVPGLDGKLSAQLDLVVKAYGQVREIIADPPESLDEVKAAIARLKPVIAALKALKAPVQDLAAVAPYADELLTDLLHRLLLIYLARWRPKLFQAAHLLTLIETAAAPFPPEPVKNSAGQVMIAPTHPTRLRFDRLASLLKDPAGVLRDYYLAAGLKTPDDAAKIANLLFPPLVRLLGEFGLAATFGLDEDAEPDLGPVGDALIRRLLTIRSNGAFGASGLDLGASLLLLSEAESGPGVAVAPFGGVDQTIELPGWDLDLNFAAAAGAFTVGANGVAVSGAAARIAAKASLAKQPAADGQALRIGSVTGTRLELSRLGVQAGFSVEAGGERDFALSAQAGAAAFILSAGDGDGFLQKVLPGEIRLPFDLGVEWSTGRGLRLNGSAGLEANLPLNASLGGVLDIKSLSLGVRASETGEILAQSAASATVRIGPISAAIEQVGVQAVLTPAKAGEAGALGPLDVAIRFKPPSGVGLTIAAGPVTGGGYLFFDPANGQYAGALQLELGGKIALGAVGLLSTRLPNDAKGFSLFVLISAEFPAIQLGYGFTLNGVGGLIGVNRTADTDALRAGIRTGALSSVLFPTDVAKNAPQIISNLNAVFPAAADRVLVGPMAKLGWGTPRILTLELGLVLEMPTPVRLMLLGRLRAILPSEEKPLVRLQMDALGVLDFDRQQASLDATLYDSRLLEFVLTGDMALRAGWGANPNFLLAIGGFNPRFKPPAGFPKLDRVALSLQQGSNLRLRLEAYLALTSNTAQFGARADLHVQAAGFTLDAYLYFDALFQFSPFAFWVDLGAMAALKYKGHSLLGVKFDMSLSGPTPWNVRGKATFEILCFDVTVDFDHTFGRREAPQPPTLAYVRPMLAEALRDVRNWSGLVTDHPLVTLRDSQGGGGLLLHPLSTLTVSQRVAPLGAKISRFGNAAPADGDYFTLEVVGEDGQPLNAKGVQARPVTDQFAPAQFREMSDAEKLAAPAFVAMQSGLTLTADEIDFPYDPALDVDMTFETAVYRHAEQPSAERLAAQSLSARMMEIAADAGPAAQARGRLARALSDA